MRFSRSLLCLQAAAEVAAALKAEQQNRHAAELVRETTFDRLVAAKAAAADALERAERAELRLGKQGGA